jgi:DNA mismatch repair protein MutL
MSKIRVMPDSLANKIAAGEVVERPASVVKELLENALDAGARRVDIEIEAGGKKLIRVVDDGEGMTRDDAIVAFERHATSKLRSSDDLDTIMTLGFRGEALPSIASVSRLSLRTRTEHDGEGTEVEFNGGKLVAVRDVAWPGGTEIEVKDLFFNIPARRKFLKSDATESVHITNLVQHYALANPHISFLLVNNGRDAIRVTPASSLKERAYQVLGGALLGKLTEVSHEVDGLRLVGFVSNPQERRSSRDAQYLFVNRRFVRDQLIGRAIAEAYRSMMPSGSHPSVVLFIDLPPSEVDVNVHPAKTEVRFLHENAILSFIRGGVEIALTATQPVTPFPNVLSRDPNRGAGPADRVAKMAAEPSFSTSETRESTRPAFGTPPSAHVGRAVEHQITGAGAAEFEIPARESIAVFEVDGGFEPVALEPLNGVKSVVDTGDDMDTGETGFRLEEAPLPGLGHGIKPLGQIRDSYIVATDEEGLLLLDQHVVHERILFEQFRDIRLARPREIQPMLIPVTLDLSPVEAEAFKVVQPELEGMGIEVMELSGRTIAVQTVPSGISSADAISLVREVLAVVERERRNFTIEDIRDSIAAELACKAAIKVNMPLTHEKMQWLIDELMKTRNPMTCPHGRPIQMRFGLRDIERGFKRPV